MDIIRIEQLEVFCNHGVYEEENVLGQKFVINADLKVSTRTAGLSDELEQSVDYGKVCHFIDIFMRENTYKLLEAAAENLASQMLKKIPGVREVAIEIRKPWAPIGLPVAYASVRIERKWHTAYIGIGSNIGNRKAYLDMAVDEIMADDNCFLSKLADVIETEPYGMDAQPDFLNSCMEIKTLYTPMELLQKCNAIETKAGRERHLRWGPRTLDLDILFYDDEIISEDNLIIPHIELHKRTFVLEPLTQIAPFKIHPMFGKRVCELLEELQGMKNE